MNGNLNRLTLGLVLCLGTVASGADKDEPAREVLALSFLGKAAVPALTEALKNKSYVIRVQAAKALWNIDRQAKVVVPVLVEALKNPQSRDEWFAGVPMLLAQIGPEAKAAVPVLVQVLNEEEQPEWTSTQRVKARRFRTAAAVALAGIDPDADAAVPVLAEAVRADDYFSNERASAALVRLGEKGLPALVDGLKADKPQVRQLAARTLEQLGSKAKTAVPYLIECLKDNNPDTRRSAASILGRLGAEAKGAVPGLREALKHDDPVARVAAASALTQVDPDVEEAIPVLLAALASGAPQRSPSPTFLRQPMRGAPDARAAQQSQFAQSAKNMARNAMRSLGPKALPPILEAFKGKDGETAVEALGLMGPAAKQAVPALIALSKAENTSVRVNAAIALSRLDGQDKVAIPVLRDALLKDQDQNTRRRASQALGQIGEAAVPALIEALTDENRSVSILVPPALGQVGEAAVPALIEALKDKDQSVRQRAATSLRMIGEPVVPALIQPLKDRDENVRRAAARTLTDEALGLLGPAAKEVLPALTELLKDENVPVRVNAAIALWRVDRQSDVAIPVLIEAMKAQNRSIGERASRALGQIGEAAVPALIQTLEHQDENVRRLAAEAVVPVLIEALKDKDNSVRQKAISVLGQIGAEAKGAVPALIEAVPALREALRNEDDVQVRNAAVPALLRILSRERGVVDLPVASILEQLGVAATEPLVAGLELDDTRIRRNAAWALIHGGAKAQLAVPALTRALADDDAVVRENAARALGALGADDHRALDALRRALKDEDARVRAAGIEYQTDDGFFDFHSLRCQFCTQVVPDPETTLSDIKTLVQHGDIRLTLDRYAKPSKASERAAVDRIRPILSDESKPTRRMHGRCPCGPHHGVSSRQALTYQALSERPGEGISYARYFRILHASAAPPRRSGRPSRR